MSQRPDSPVPDKPEDATGEDEQLVHHVSQRKKRKKGVGGEAMELQLTSMIDVIFQLLIYFVITANFMIDEGTIIATLPGDASPTSEVKPPDDPPILIEMGPTADGIGYVMRIKGNPIAGTTGLHSYLEGQIAGGSLAKDRQVQIQPQDKVRWQHVVNVFNTCVSLELSNVGFAPGGAAAE